MTSNLGSDLILQTESVDEVRDRLDALLKATFRPEFLNRVDEIITFRRLSKDDIMRIVEIQLSRLAARLADRKLTLKVEDSAKHFLADEGYDPAFGARPLKRTIQNRIQNPLAKKILSGEIVEGQTVVIGAKKGEISLIGT
jgi:ATP-dependent Clp protease ATP-binding subunit ClpB